MNTSDAANYIGMSASWLNKTRMHGNGPAYIKLGGSVKYLKSDLDSWMAANRRTAVYDFANDNTVTTPLARSEMARATA